MSEKKPIKLEPKLETRTFSVTREVPVAKIFLTEEEVAQAIREYITRRLTKEEVETFRLIQIDLDLDFQVPVTLIGGTEQ